MLKDKQFWLITFGLIFILFACSSSPEETVPPEPLVVDLAPVVSATGEVVPQQEALLSVWVSGIAEDVLVKKGDRVSTGQVLVQLESTEEQQAAVSAAELELLNAQIALEALFKDTDLLAAQALRQCHARLADLTQSSAGLLERGTICPFREPFWSWLHVIDEKALLNPWMTTNDGTKHGYVRFDPRLLCETRDHIVARVEQDKPSEEAQQDRSSVH